MYHMVPRSLAGSGDEKHLPGYCYYYYIKYFGNYSVLILTFLPEKAIPSLRISVTPISVISES